MSKTKSEFDRSKRKKKVSSLPVKKPTAEKGVRNDEEFSDFFLPMELKGWMVAVLPVRMKSVTDGGIALPEEYLQENESLASVGRVAQMGDSAFTAKTRAGIDMAEDPVKIEVGDYVIYPLYAGMSMPIWGEKPDGTKESQLVRILKDDSIIAKTKYPGAFLDISN